MSKSVKCPSCRMRGKANGEDFALVATHRGRPVVQCFWCDSQVHIPRFKKPYLIEVEPQYEAVFNFQRAIEYESLMDLMDVDSEFADEPTVTILRPQTEAQDATKIDEAVEAPEFHVVEGRKPEIDDQDDDRWDEEFGKWFDEDADVLEPAACEQTEPEPVEAPAIEESKPLLPVAFQDERPRDPEPHPVDTRVHNLLQLANQVGWVHPVNRRYQPEFMNIKIPPMRPMTERQAMWHEVRMMMKYFQIDAGDKQQRAREAEARKARMMQAKQLRKDQRRLRLDLRKFETGEVL